MDIQFRNRYGKNFSHRGYKTQKDEKERITKSSYLNIWEEIPSFKDINLLFVLSKIVVFLGIITFIILYIFFLTRNLIFALVGPLIFGIILFMIFCDNLFVVEILSGRRYGKIDLFSGFEFWKTTDDVYTIYLSNTKDLMHTGIRIYKIAVIPENIQPNLNHLIKSLWNAEIPFTYQVVQNPIVQERSQTVQIEIFFALSYYETGILTQTKLSKIRDALEEFSYTFKSICIANLAHFKIDLLGGNKLLEAIQTFLLGSSVEIPNEKQIRNETPPNNVLAFLKGIMILSFLLYLDFIMLSSVDFLIIILFNVIIIAVVFGLYWREAVFYISHLLFIREEKEPISYFHNLNLYRLKGLKDYLFLYIENKYLVGIGLLRLEYTTPPQFTSDGYFLAHPDKFFRSMVNRKLPYTYTLVNSPLSYENFEKASLDYLGEFPKQLLLQRETEAGREEWMQMRGGIWRMSNLFSIQEVQYTKTLSDTVIEKMVKQLDLKIKEFINIYKSNFTNYHLKLLTNRHMIPAMRTILLKSKFFRLAGTHLDYSIVQGKTLMNLCEIANEFKKGVETRVAAEFNSPLHIENEIIIGQTINTEFLEREIPAGFTVDQMKNLLITNGSSKDRKALLLTIGMELIRNKVPSIIFDFSGAFTRLLTYFQDSEYEDQILHFKLGKNFQINPLETDIFNDKKDKRYDDLLIDAWGMCFKENSRAIQTFKQYLQKFREEGRTDLSAIALEIETSKDYQKSPYADSILSLLKDFTEDAIYVPNLEDEKKEMEIKPHEFIQRKETVILDLSLLRDLEQKVFLSSVIFAKIIHYIEQYSNYHEKIFLFPNADILFDNWYLEKSNHLRYGKVNKFLEPLFQSGFGFVITANQIRHLHPNAMTYFRNIISFRAVDKRDISSLKNLMNLSELHGVGYYSKSRKDSYQVDFLTNLHKKEALVRRHDYNQPYPIEIEDKIVHLPKMRYIDILDHMKRNGYNLRNIENRILSGANRTLFETHFQNYIIFLEEIITFFTILGRLDKVGNLYKAKIKEELLKLIYPRAKERFQNDAVMIREARDRLFDIFLRYNYIVEDHPRRASGSQSIRTSYAVGPQYKESLDDYYKSRDNTPLDVSVETVEKESEMDYELEEVFSSDDSNDLDFSKNISQQFSKKELEERFKNLLITDFFYDLSQVNLKLKRQKYRDVLLLEREALRKFFITFYCNFHPHQAKDLSNISVEKAIDFIDKFLDLPVTKSQMIKLVDSLDVEVEAQNNRNQIITENFEKLLHFFHSLYGYFRKNQNSDRQRRGI